MGKRHAIALAIIGLLVALGWVLARRALDPDRRAETRDASQTGAIGGPAAAGGELEIPDDAVIRDDVVYTPRDVEIFREVMASAARDRLDTLELGQIIVRVGRRFVGEPYTPQTLELEGPERVVVNLREFDCVTYVESVLALARLIRDGRAEFGAFAEELRGMRYRDGQLDGYISRLHYFSEWISDNERRGVLQDITASLGGTAEREPIDFMSRNASAYPRLVERPELVEEVAAIERRLSGGARHVIHQDRIAPAAGRIRDGDVIAATSNIRGLDVAHTGFALRVDGRLHLMHAPLVGRVLEISERPLAERIRRIDGQDGIMVARPL